MIDIGIDAAWRSISLPPGKASLHRCFAAPGTNAYSLGRWSFHPRDVLLSYASLFNFTTTPVPILRAGSLPGHLPSGLLAMSRCQWTSTVSLHVHDIVLTDKIGVSVARSAPVWFFDQR